MIYYVKKPLTYAGKSYKRGDQLSVKTGIRDAQIIRAMIRMGKISKEPLADATVVADSVLEPETGKTVSMDKATLLHTGGGYWSVMMGDMCISEGTKLQGKDAAIAWCHENDVDIVTE